MNHLQQQKLSTALLLNGGLRSLFTVAAQIYTYRLFISNIGAKDWSILFLISQAFIILGTFPLLKVNARIGNIIFGNLLALLLGANLFLLTGVNPIAIYLFGIMVHVADIIGGTAANALSSKIFTPYHYREFSQKLITVDLMVRVIGSVVVWLISEYKIDQMFLIFTASLLVVNIITVFAISQLAKNVTQDQNAFRPEKTPVTQTGIVETFADILNNPLLKSILVIMIWTQVARYFSQLLYFQSVQEKFPDESNMGSFLSIMTLVIIGCSIVFQRTLGAKLVRTKSPSSLLSLLPTLYIGLSTLSLFFFSAEILIAQWVFAAFINKVIQSPVNSQVMFTVENHKRERVAYSFSLMIGLVMVGISGVGSLIKDSLGITELSIILGIFSASILLIVTRLDHFYLRGLWKGFKSAVQRTPVLNALYTNDFGTPQIFSNTIELNDGELPEFEEEHAESLVHSLTYHEIKNYLIHNPTCSVDLAAEVIAFSYRYHHTEEMIHRICGLHKNLLKSKEKRLNIIGLRAMNLLCLPEFDPIIENFKNHSDSDISKEANTISEITATINKASTMDLPSIDLLKYRSFLIQKLRDSSVIDFKEKAAYLLALKDRDLKKNLIRVLKRCENDDQLRRIFDCIIIESSSFHIKPIVELFLKKPYLESEWERNFLAFIPSFDDDPSSISNLLESEIEILEKKEFSLWKPISVDDQEQFKKALFLIEWSHMGSIDPRKLLKSIPDFNQLSRRHLEIWAHLHYEYLEGTPYRRFRKLLRPA